MNQPLLSARGLRLAFGGVKAADGIDLDVMPGEFLAIIGPNGAGKTTFINMSTGYLRPQAGSIAFDGQPILGLRPRAIVRRGIGRSFQLPQLFTEHTVLRMPPWPSPPAWGCGRRWCRCCGRPGGRRRWRCWSASAWPAWRSPRHALNEAPQAGHIAMAAALQPRLLLMDEPTSGVAAAEKMDIVETLVRVLRDSGVTAVFVEHDMDVVARFADRVAVWSQGRSPRSARPNRCWRTRWCSGT